MVEIRLEGDLEEEFERLKTELSDRRDEKMTNREVAELLVEEVKSDDLEVETD